MSGELGERPVPALAIELKGGWRPMLLRRIFIGAFLTLYFAKRYAFAETLADSVTSSATKMELSVVRGGTFAMGSPADEPERNDNEDQHTVELTRPYYLGDSEVTQEAFEKVMAHNPSTKRGDPRLPVEAVTWFDAVSFCNRLSEMEGLERVYDLAATSTEELHVTAATVSRRFPSTGRGERWKIYIRRDEPSRLVSVTFSRIVLWTSWFTTRQYLPSIK